MLSEGITFHASWVPSAGVRCFLLIEALNLEPLIPGAIVGVI
jgi:hypothetical protein